MVRTIAARSTRTATPNSPVPRALALLGVDAARGDPPPLGMIREQLQRARSYRGTAVEALLPIEKPAVVRVLDRQINALENGVSGYRRIPLAALREVLGWRNADGMPTLAPFSVERNTFEFFCSDMYTCRITPALPEPLRGCYDDVMKRLMDRRRERNVAVRAIARFDGMIPDDVRRTIIGAQKQFKDIRILAEVERWQIEETELPALNADPLVIGYDGEEFWLLATFDITPLEDAVRQICLGKELTDS